MDPRTITFIIGLLSTPLIAQISQGGQPFSWGDHLDHGMLPMVQPQPASDRMPADTAATEGLIPYGTQRSLSIDVLEQGLWDTLPDQRRRCRLVIKSPGAAMLSLQFDVFDPAPGVWMYLYDPQRTAFLGGFTELNELPDGGLATAVLPGEAIVIEWIEPGPVINDPSRLHLSSLTHGFVNILTAGGSGQLRDYDPGYQSAPCHNNVNCPIAASWQNVKHATAMFLRPDGNGCTGTLLNNTLQDGTPYFLVANHCYQATTSQWVFYFNYESPTCTGSSGPTTQTITGAALIASDATDDFALVQLSSVPPASYSPYYAGWDHSGNTPSSTTAILHPLYDVKKITFDNNAPGSTTNANGSPRWQCFWDSGIIESGASGSPLYDPTHHFIGHVVTGAQDCTNSATVPSGAVKLSGSWNGSSSTTRLRDWLDPANTTTVLDGYDPNGTPLSEVLVRPKVFLEGPYNGNTTMTNHLRTQGLIPLEEPYTGLGYVHQGGGGGESTTAAVLAAGGQDAVVDWVVVELRNKNNSSNIVATRSALLLRTGMVVDVDGTSDVSFTLPADDYYIAIRHRNHFGAMTQNPQSLGSTATLKDFTTTTLPLYGGSAATKTISGRRCLYGGDVNMDGFVKYTGADNDADLVLAAIGGSVSTNTVNAYSSEDVNMDAVVKYTGSGNDRDIILVNIGGIIPTDILVEQMP